MNQTLLVAFDLDDTLAPSKTRIGADMAQRLGQLLEFVEVCIISGGRYEQFATQVLAALRSDAKLERLHIMPTCGTRYLRYASGQWREVYAHDLTDDEKSRAISVLEDSAKKLGLWCGDDIVAGDRIEDRGSQITFSALGQRAEVADKKAWDPSGEKREALRAEVAELLPDLEVRAGGSTSIDITRKGIDKAYGMGKLIEVTGIPGDQMLFIGDRLMPGGNDYPVKAMGLPCHEVTGPDDTLRFLDELMTSWRKDER